MSKTLESVAKAKAIANRFESAHKQATAEGVDITRVGWASFSERMLAPFQKNDLLKHLASYALRDAEFLVTRIQEGLPLDMPIDERRALLHANVENIIDPPGEMTDS